jgi:hypothetical protein
MTRQNTADIMMIRPVRFNFNTQTAESNSFQNTQTIENENTTQNKALEEFDGMVNILRNKGVKVYVFEDTPEPHTPDSIFPNNWVSFHQNGSVILYPMQAPNRRLERRQDIIESLKQNFEIKEVNDFSSAEKENIFLEGTGSLVFDRPNQIAYCCISPRADLKLAQRFCQQFGWNLVSFDALDKAGKPIYHTNVVMCVGDKFAVLCLDCVPDESQRKNLIENLEKSGKEVVLISFEQLENFAGNMLNIENEKGEKLLVMSERAYKSLNNTQIEILEKYATIVYAPLTTIENNGGGSARCMMAEIFLDRK